MLGDGTAFLHGRGVLTYKTMELDAEYIRVKSDSSTIYAIGVYDSVADEWKGKPVFKDGKDSYEYRQSHLNGCHTGTDGISAGLVIGTPRAHKSSV